MSRHTEESYRDAAAVEEAVIEYCASFAGLRPAAVTHAEAQAEVRLAAFRNKIRGYELERKGPGK